MVCRVAYQHNESNRTEVWDERGPEATLAEELRKWRAARGWSQQDVADRMSRNFGYGWHQTTVARIEGRARPLRLNETVALAMLFDVDLAQLLRPPQATVAEIEQLRRREAELTAREQALAEMRDRVRRQLDDVHQEMAMVDQAHQDVRLELEHVKRRVFLSFHTEDDHLFHVDVISRLCREDPARAASTQGEGREEAPADRHEGGRDR